MNHGHESHPGPGVDPSHSDPSRNKMAELVSHLHHPAPQTENQENKCVCLSVCRPDSSKQIRLSSFSVSAQVAIVLVANRRRDQAADVPAQQLVPFPTGDLINTDRGEKKAVREISSDFTRITFAVTLLTNVMRPFASHTMVASVCGLVRNDKERDEEEFPSTRPCRQRRSPYFSHLSSRLLSFSSDASLPLQPLACRPP